jgi:hypothetical protein
MPYKEKDIHTYTFDSKKAAKNLDFAKIVNFYNFLQSIKKGATINQISLRLPYQFLLTGV